MTLRYIACAVIAYLLGSISSGILLTRNTGTDIRKEGSGNTGASNALRVFGVRVGLITFICDVLKAAAAVLIGKWLAGEYGGMLGGLFAIIGHNWPVFFSFKGGKGIACSCAVVLLNFPIPGLIAILICIAAIALTRYISVGSMLLLTSYAVILCATRPFWPYGIWAIILAVMAIARHHGNIRRLLNGTENKLTFRKK